MYNLTEDEVLLVDGGGDGGRGRSSGRSSSGYPASSIAMRDQARRSTLEQKQNLLGISGSVIGVVGTCNPASFSTGFGAAACVSSAIGLAQGFAGMAGGRGL